MRLWQRWGPAVGQNLRDRRLHDRPASALFISAASALGQAVLLSLLMGLLIIGFADAIAARSVWAALSALILTLLIVVWVIMCLAIARSAFGHALEVLLGVRPDQSVARIAIFALTVWAFVVLYGTVLQQGVKELGGFEELNTRLDAANFDLEWMPPE